jgi:Zn-dependent protease/predicted transcriptional regulator
VSSSIRLGRIAGIEIGVNWSWLAVVALIVWSLASSVFPSAVPGFSDATYYAMAIAAALLFFSSLLLHELGHAIEARRQGMQIDGITLWLFGGVARFRGMFPSAWAELRIALAGPLVSLVLGAAFIGAALAYSGAREVDAVLAWLGEINIVLLVFNLLPALPLDGGRVLRSVLWGVRGNFASATRVAAAVGRTFGALFVAGGLALVFFENATNGIWLALLGWFLFAAATSEAQAGAVQAALGRMRVRDVMVRQPTSVRPGQTIGELMDRLIWTDRHQAYPVVDGDRAVGLLPFAAIAQVPRQDWDSRTVADSMTPLRDVPVLSEEDTLDDALAKLGNDTGRGLVLDGERLCGLLSVADIARAFERDRRPS